MESGEFEYARKIIAALERDYEEVAGELEHDDSSTSYDSNSRGELKKLELKAGEH
jgi:hypothetical protein